MNISFDSARNFINNHPYASFLVTNICLIPIIDKVSNIVSNQFIDEKSAIQSDKKRHYIKLSLDGCFIFASNFVINKLIGSHFKIQALAAITAIAITAKILFIDSENSQNLEKPKKQESKQEDSSKQRSSENKVAPETQLQHTVEAQKKAVEEGVTSKPSAEDPATPEKKQKTEVPSTTLTPLIIDDDEIPGDDVSVTNKEQPEAKRSPTQALVNEKQGVAEMPSKAATIEKQAIQQEENPEEKKSVIDFKRRPSVKQRIVDFELSGIVYGAKTEVIKRTQDDIEVGIITNIRKPKIVHKRHKSSSTLPSFKDMRMDNS